MDTLKQLTCVYIDMRLWEGRKKLTAEDLRPAGLTEAPPERLMSLGSKRIFPAEPLRTFYALRKRAERLCEENGTRFLNGFIIPAQNRSTLAAKLDALKEKFYSTLDDLMQHYDQHLNSFIAEFPQWEAGIRSALLSSDEARQRFRFKRVFFDVSVPENMEENSNLDTELDGIAGQVLHELSLVAGELMRTSLVPKKDMARQSTRRILNEMLDKVLGFGFIDRRLAAIAVKLQAIHDSLPATGMIVGTDFANLRKTFEVMADPKKSSNPANLPDCKPRFQPTAKPARQAAKAGTVAKGFDTSIL